MNSMNIEKMTKKDFENLPYIDDRLIDINGIVLLPTKRMDSSGYRLYEVIPCYYSEPLGKLYGYDTFSIIMESKYNRVGIDCLTVA